jgi:hypothetical protein
LGAAARRQAKTRRVADFGWAAILVPVAKATGGRGRRLFAPAPNALPPQTHAVSARAVAQPFARGDHRLGGADLFRTTADDAFAVVRTRVVIADALESVVQGGGNGDGPHAPIQRIAGITGSVTVRVDLVWIWKIGTIIGAIGNAVIIIVDADGKLCATAQKDNALEDPCARPE